MMKKILIALTICLSVMAGRAQNNPCIAYTSYSCSSASGAPFTISKANSSLFPTIFDGETVQITATPTRGLPGLLVSSNVDEYCQMSTYIAPLSSSQIVSSSWVATFPNGSSVSGPGLTASFIGIGVGTGTLTFHMTYTNASVCGPGTSQVSMATNFFVSSVISGPVDQGVCPGAFVSFSVSTTITNPVTYQWIKNFTPITGATNSIFTIASCSTADAAVYSVVVSFEGVSVPSYRAQLNVNSQALNSRIGHWAFNDPPYWKEDSGMNPNSSFNLNAIPSWSGYSVSITPTRLANLSYPAENPSGCPVLTIPQGSIRFWYKPDWSSVNNFQIAGPGDNIRLFEVGKQSDDASYGWAGLTINPIGTQLSFTTQAAGVNQMNATCPINFNSKTWYQIVLTYSPTQTMLYVNGQAMGAAGSGWVNVLSTAISQKGFSLGCSSDGIHQANGCFDELETFNYVLSPSNIATEYSSLMSVDTDGDGLPDIVESGLGTNPYAMDTDCDGLPDGWEVAHGLNPLDPSDATPCWLELYKGIINSYQTNNSPSDPNGVFLSSATITDVSQAGNFSFGSYFPPGDYEVRYDQGCWAFNGQHWCVDQIAAGVANMPHSINVVFSAGPCDGSGSICLNSTLLGYDLQSDAQAASQGAFVKFHHTGGSISMSFVDNPYNDNTLGDTPPQYSLYSDSSPFTISSFATTTLSSGQTQTIFQVYNQSAMTFASINVTLNFSDGSISPVTITTTGFNSGQQTASLTFTYSRAANAQTVPQATLTFANEGLIIGASSVQLWPQGAPIVLDARPGQLAAFLVWNPSPTIQSYNVFRAYSANGVWASLGNTTTCNYQDLNLSTNSVYYYKIIANDDSASEVESVQPFGCAAPLRPIIDYVDPLQILAVNGSYPVNYQMLLTNSDAYDPQGMPLSFYVSSVVSGSLMINGSPFGVVNNLITTNSTVLWTPPPNILSSNIPAFIVYVADAANLSTNNANVFIKQHPTAHLYAWGDNWWGAVGNGAVRRNFSGSTDHDTLQEQSDCNIIARDPRWYYTNIDYQNEAVYLPTQVLDLDSVAKVSSDGIVSSAVTPDGQLWQWGGAGYGSGPVFGKKLVRANKSDSSLDYRINVSGDPFPTGYSSAFIYSLYVPSPTKCLIAQNGIADNYASGETVISGDYYTNQCSHSMTWQLGVPLSSQQQPFTNVQSICGDSDSQIALLKDGSLWSWGSPLGGPYGTDQGVLGRDPTAENDKFTDGEGFLFGMQPGQIAIPPVSEIHFMTVGCAIALCRDGSVWTWGAPLCAITGADTAGYGIYDPFPLVPNQGQSSQPARITTLDVANAAPVISVSVGAEHIVILRKDGSVSELGYVASLDSSGAVGNEAIPIISADDFDHCFSSAPVNVTGLPSDIVQISAADNFGAALTQDGSVWVWGYFPDSTLVSPRKISSFHNITKIAAGQSYAPDTYADGTTKMSSFILGLCQNGRVYGIGRDSVALGSDTSLHTSAFPIPGLENVTDVFVGEGGPWWTTCFAVGTAEINKPTELVASPGNQCVQLSWDNFPSANYYIVYRSLNEDTGYQPIAHVTTNSFLDQSPPLQNGQIYYYTVSAVVIGVESDQSWDVSAIPYPVPTAVQNLSVTWDCHGTKLQWQPPANSAASPISSYIIKLGNQILATLQPSSTDFYDHSAIFGQNYTYSVVAYNSAGQSAVTGSPTGVPSCLPPPQIEVDDWLEVAAVDIGSDQATLSWTGPTNGTWQFQTYEFNPNHINDFISNLSQHDDTTFSGWIWAQLTSDEMSTLLSNEAQTTKVGTLINALNRIIAAGQSVANSSYLNAGIPLRAQTTALMNSSLDQSSSVQLNRMLLDDFFQGSYFTRGPNWGSSLTGFRIYYTSEFFATGDSIASQYLGRKIQTSLQKDIPVNELTYQSMQDGEDIFCGSFQTTWIVPQGAQCWASVSALLGDEETAISLVSAPRSADYYSPSWNPSLTAIPGYQQVYLQWADSPDISEYNVYYFQANNTSPVGDDACSTAPWILLTNNLTLNRFWQTNLSPGTYYYKVEAIPYAADAGYLSSCTNNVIPVSATVNVVPAPAQYQFFADACPYDNMVLVEWLVPSNQTTTGPISLVQTNWQFYLERKSGGADDTTYQTLTDIGYGLAFLDTNVIDGQSYTYRVTAFDVNFNRLQAIAVVKGATSIQITPAATNGLTLLNPIPGNSFVDLTWSPIRAAIINVYHSLNASGPFDLVESLDAQNAYQNAPNMFRHTGLQNGVSHYYKIAAITPTGFEIDSDVKSAIPLSTLTPLPPSGFQATLVKSDDSPQILLTWQPETGINHYQLFLQGLSGFSSIYDRGGNSYTFSLPDDSNPNDVFQFAIRAVNSGSLVSDFAYATATNQSPPDVSVAQPVMLQVNGWVPISLSDILQLTGPTNIVLNANINLPSVSAVYFYDNGQLVASSVSSSPQTTFQTTWYNVPGGSHSIIATVIVQDPSGGIFGGASGSFSSSPSLVEVTVQPQLAAYQLSATDLQLPGKVPITLTRSYSSRTTVLDPSLGIGWQGNWNMGKLTISGDLTAGWSGLKQSSFGNPQYYICDVRGHYLTLTLPSGATVGFAPQLNYDLSESPDYYAAAENAHVSMSFQPFSLNQGALISDGCKNISVGISSDDWTSSSPVTLGDIHPTYFLYTEPSGTQYTYQTVNGAWSLTKIADRNGNTLTYTYGSSDTTVASYNQYSAGKVTCISGSNGKTATFAYPNGSEIDVFDSLSSGAGAFPAVKYILAAGQTTGNSHLVQVQRLTDRVTGHYDTIKYQYGDNSSSPQDVDRLTQVFDARGVCTSTIEYAVGDANGNGPNIGNIATQTGISKNTSAYALDAQNNLTLTTTSTAGVITAKITCDESGAITGSTQPVAGNTPSTSMAVQCSYDALGRLVAQTDALGNTKTFTYDDLNRLVGQSDANGNSTSTTLRPDGTPSISTDANGNQTRYEYDANGNPTLVSDSSGTVTAYTYFPATSTMPELLASQTQSAPFVPYTIVTLNGYDSIGQLTSTTQQWADANNVVVGKPVISTYEYDNNGNRTAENRFRTVNGATETLRTEYSYDAQNRVTQTLVRAKSGTATVYANLQTNSVSYNSLGKQATTTDSAGNITTYVYDFAGNLVETRYVDGTVSRTSYDGLNRQVFVQDRAMTNSSGSTTAPGTESFYDASGRVISSERFAAVTLTLSPVGSDNPNIDPSLGMCEMIASAPTVPMTTNYTFYDAAGRLQFSVDARGKVTQSIYDSAGQRLQTVVYTAYIFNPAQSAIPNPTGSYLVTTYIYDANGNVTSTTDSAGNMTVSVYDAANRVIAVQLPQTSAGSATRSTSYDGLGRMILETDEAGVVTAYTYDFQGLLTSVTLAFGTTQSVTTVYQYDEAGNLVAQTDAAGHTTTFAYDALGRRTSRTLPGQQTEYYTYDGLGNVLSQTTFNGAVIASHYDLMNRLTNRSAAGYQISFTYNPTNGLRTNMIDPSGNTAWKYDALGRLTNKTVAIASGPTMSLNYGYDSLGTLTNLSSGSSGGVRNGYGYDLLGRLTTVVTADSAAAATYGYDAVGNLQTAAFGNGVTNLYQYDARNRLVNLVEKLGTSARASYAYQLGVTGNRLGCSEAVNGISRNYAWTYDLMYRLTGESLTGAQLGNAAYTFDAVGNRTSRQANLGTLGNTTASYDANDRLTTDNYDSNGNTTTSGGTGYVYDALNHLINVNNGQMTLAYDGDGNRVSKTVNGVTTYYLVDDRNPTGYPQVVEEWSKVPGASPALSELYNYGLSLISEDSGGIAKYYGQDGHGSVRFLASAAGIITDTYAYDAYGTLMASTGGTANRYLYCSEQFDPDLGMYYLRARYYQPQTGRFWTMDTEQGNEEDPQSLHKYLFGADDPVNELDPSGQSFFGFDGTGNSPTRNLSNVYKMVFGSTDPHAHYEVGVGTAWGTRTFAGATGLGMARRENKAMGELIADRAAGDTEVDIVGFSRGGIEATEFANRVADAFPDEKIRFVGLFDPVGSVGHPGGFGGYRSQLPSSVGYSVEAMAANENRSFFPGTDVNVNLQQWFRGTHSDIGGGWPNHQLSDYVLQWMIQQAQSKGVGINLSAIQAKFGWDPNPNAAIDPNQGFTSWFTTGSVRNVLSATGGGYTVSPSDIGF